MNIEMFLETLPIMGKGMLGIFVVTFAIIIMTALIRKIGDRFGKKDNDNESK